MRTVKASEVRKGMRVRVEHERGGATQTLEGVVEESRSSDFGDGWYIRVGNLLHANVSPDHPVTVLAEPEPEWVEGAWYWTLAASQTTPRIRKRMERGWGSVGVDGTNTAWLDNGAADITVLGRVLIVDWPGDEHASELVENYGPGLTWDDFECSPLQKVADAIRTQGGVR